MEQSFKEFLDLAAKMRKYQRRWFRGKKPSDLQTAKALERQIDNRINELQENQQTLFD